MCFKFPYFCVKKKSSNGNGPHTKKFPSPFFNTFLIVLPLADLGELNDNHFICALVAISLTKCFEWNTNFVISMHFVTKIQRSQINVTHPYSVRQKKVRKTGKVHSCVWLPKCSFVFLSFILAYRNANAQFTLYPFTSFVGRAFLIRFYRESIDKRIA